MVHQFPTDLVDGDDAQSMLTASLIATIRLTAQLYVALATSQNRPARSYRIRLYWKTRPEFSRPGAATMNAAPSRAMHRGRLPPHQLDAQLRLLADLQPRRSASPRRPNRAGFGLAFPC